VGAGVVMQPTGARIGSGGTLSLLVKGWGREARPPSAPSCTQLTAKGCPPDPVKSLTATGPAVHDACLPACPPIAPKGRGRLRTSPQLMTEAFYFKMEVVMDTEDCG
jgi:hypothetical protein